MKKIGCLLALLICIHSAHGQDYSAYKKRLFVRQKDTLRYRILYPENYNKKAAYPLVVFLHGAGERGSDNERQLDNGGDIFLRDSMRKKYPAIVIFPQCPADSFWFSFTMRMDTATPAEWNRSLNIGALRTPERLVKQLMDSLEQNNIADKNRIYLGGLSLGGFGTYDLVARYPGYFAAAFPICGQANVAVFVARAAKVPIWIFHGAVDNVIPVQPDRDLYHALQRTGARDVRYSEYPGVYHNSWVNAFAEPALIPWLFSFKNRH